MVHRPQISNELLPGDAGSTQPNATDADVEGGHMECWRCSLAIACARPAHAGLYVLRVRASSSATSRASGDGDQIHIDRPADVYSQADAVSSRSAADAGTNGTGPETGTAETACQLAVLPALQLRSRFSTPAVPSESALKAIAHAADGPRVLTAKAHSVPAANRDERLHAEAADAAGLIPIDNLLTGEFHSQSQD